MAAKLVLLLNCLIAANCRSSIPSRNDVAYVEPDEIESIRQQDSIRIEIQAIQEMKSDIEEILQAVIQQQNRPRKECPFGFDYLPEPGRCFIIIFEAMDWNRATERCRGIMSGAHLAAIRSQEDQTAIAKYLHSQFTKTNIRSHSENGYCAGGYLVWIAGQRKSGRCENPFVWKTLNGIEVPFNYTNWGPSEPNCAQGETCVHMTSCADHAWNDYICRFSSFPLCEI